MDWSESPFEVPSSQDMTLHVLGSTLSWTVLYKAIRMSDANGNMDLQCRTVSAVHGLLVSVMSALALHYTNNHDVNAFTDTSMSEMMTPLQYAVAVASVGYFTYDLFWCLATRPDGLAFYVVHHLICIGSLMYAILTLKFGNEVIVYMFLNEVTNPSLQLEAAFRVWEKEGTWYAHGNFAWVVLGTLFCRAVIGSRVTYQALAHPVLSITLKLAAIFVYALGCFVCYQWLEKAFQKYLKGSAQVQDKEA